MDKAQLHGKVVVKLAKIPLKLKFGWEVTEMSAEKIHYTTPIKYGVVNYEKYVYAICRCPLGLSYGLRIDRSNLTDEEIESGWCHIHCEKCGSSIAVAI